MNSCQWFQRKYLLRTGQKLLKITQNYMKNSNSTLILTNLLRGTNKEHSYKILSKSMHCFKRSQKYDIT